MYSVPTSAAMEGKTLVLIQALGRNNDGKVSTVTALLLDELSNTTSTVNLSVDEFKKSAEGALALESYLHNDPNPNPSKGSNNKPCNDTRSNDTHLNPGNNADEELDRMLYKPIYLALINAPQCTKIAIEALIGAPIEDLDTSTTLSNKSTVNWLHFSVKGNPTTPPFYTPESAAQQLLQVYRTPRKAYRK